MSKIHIHICLHNLVLAASLCEYLDRELDFWHRCITREDNTVPGEPDMVLVDQASLKQGIFERWPDSKVILLDTGLSESEIITILLTYRLRGVIDHNTDTQLFIKALTVIHSGQVWIDNRTLKALLGHSETFSQTRNLERISPKEQEVIILVSQGCRNREIASKLNISEQTVKVHISNIFRKANVTTRSQLVPLAMQFRFSPA